MKEALGINGKEVGKAMTEQRLWMVANPEAREFLASGNTQGGDEMDIIKEKCTEHLMAWLGNQEG